MNRTIRALVLTTAPMALLLGAGCSEQETTTVGNVWSDCPAGTACSCSLVGNCFVNCTGGGCDLTCSGTSNC